MKLQELKSNISASYFTIIVTSLGGYRSVIQVLKPEYITITITMDRIESTKFQFLN